MYHMVCHIHIDTVEVGETVKSLNILNTELDLAVDKLPVLLEVCEGDIYHTSFETVGNNLLSSGLGDQGLSEVLIRYIRNSIFKDMYKIQHENYFN